MVCGATAEAGVANRNHVNAGKIAEVKRRNSFFIPKDTMNI
jgi:hypothetical protein